MNQVNKKRVRVLKDGVTGKGPIAYWMSRDQRAEDNWAILHAQHLALVRKGPLLVVFCLVPTFLNVTMRQYGFMEDVLGQEDFGVDGNSDRCPPDCHLPQRQV